MTRPILITGASGFVGSAVVRRMAGRPAILSARRGSDENGQTVHAADLTDHSRLMEIAQGVRSIIHCASYVGENAEEAWWVNDEGTRIIADVARRLSIVSLVYVSTTAVYGVGTHDGTRETAPTRPASEASRSRLSAEQRVLSAGGSVIRPHLVYGTGDRWFIPRLAEAARLLGGLPANIRVSTINVEALAAQAVALSDSIKRHAGPGVYNASHDLPTLLDQVLRDSLLPRIVDISGAGPGRRTRLTLAQAGFSGHQVDMLTRRNTFDSRIHTWVPGITPPRRFELSRSETNWYRREYSKP